MNLKYLCILGLFLVLTQANAQTDLITAFDKYVEESRQKFEVPGCAVAVVKDGEIQFIKGYGNLAVDDDRSVDTKTLFGMMSTTKAMTAVALGILVDQGKIKWEDRVIQHLPNFQLYDPFVTREARVKDLLTHNLGLGNADFLWAYNAKADQDFILKQMRLAEPVYSLRNGFIYQNIMYLVAGMVIEEVSGMTWERFMKEHVYQPLSMENTFPNLAYSTQYHNRSKAHWHTDNGIVSIPEMPADAIGPAGATWSTAEDVAKWMLFLLGDGKVGEQQVLQSETLAEMFKPQVILPETQFYPTAQLTKPHWMTYSLGWFQQDYRGEFLSFHTGSLAGRTAIVGLLPDHDFGFYFFGNLDHAELRHALMLKSIDHFVFEDNQRDWSEEIFDLYAGIKAVGEKNAATIDSLRIDGTQATKNLRAYSGTYEHPYYGKIKIDFTDGLLLAHIGTSIKGQLNHWHLDSFRLTTDLLWFGQPFLNFHFGPVNGSVTSLHFNDIVFKKIK